MDRILELGNTTQRQLYGWKPTERDLLGVKESDEFKTQDHAAVREMIVAWVRQTGLKVLACPEMTHQVELAKEH